MNKNTVFQIILCFFLSFNLWSERPPDALKLDTAYDLFKGDWLDTWDDPGDKRFIDQGIDLKKHFKETTYIREELFNLREKFGKQFEDIKDDPKGDFIQLSKDITKATVDFTVKYLDQARPASISKDEIAFISFGSMARQESGIVTDLEGSLLWDKNVVGKEALGFVFGQSLSNLLDGLIGHPIYGLRGFRLDEAEHSPFHKAPWARLMSLRQAYCTALNSLPLDGVRKSINEFRKSYYYPFEGSWIYTGSTPQVLGGFVDAAKFKDWPSMWATNLKEADLKTEWYQWAEPYLSSPLIDADYIAKVLNGAACTKDMDSDTIQNKANIMSLRMKSTEIATMGNVAQLTRNRTFVYGNKDLFDDFENTRSKILNDNKQALRKNLAFQFLKQLVQYIEDPELGIVTGKAPDFLDIKRFNYRFEEQLNTNLAFLLDLKEQNQGDIIKTLIEKEIFGKEFGKRAHDRVNKMIRLRLKKQIALQTQLEKNMLFLTKEAHAKKLEELQGEKEKNEKVLNNPDEGDGAKRKATNNLIDINANLKLMPKLIPGNADSILTEDDIEYLKTTLFPEQADVFKRLGEFLENNNSHSKAFNFDAFKD